MSTNHITKNRNLTPRTAMHCVPKCPEFRCAVVVGLNVFMDKEYNENNPWYTNAHLVFGFQCISCDEILSADDIGGVDLDKDFLGFCVQASKLLEKKDALLKKMKESLSQLGSKNTKLVIDNKESALEIESEKKNAKAFKNI